MRVVCVGDRVAGIGTLHRRLARTRAATGGTVAVAPVIVIAASKVGSATARPLRGGIRRLAPRNRWRGAAVGTFIECEFSPPAANDHPHVVVAADVLKCLLPRRIRDRRENLPIGRSSHEVEHLHADHRGARRPHALGLAHDDVRQAASAGSGGGGEHGRHLTVARDSPK